MKTLVVLISALTLLPTLAPSQSLVTLEANGRRLLGGIGMAWPTSVGSLGIILEGTTTLRVNHPRYGGGISFRMKNGHISLGVGALYIDGIPYDGRGEPYYPPGVVAHWTLGLGLDRAHVTVSYLSIRETPILVGVLLSL